MNRVGDAGLAIAIFVMFATLGTTRYAGVFGAPAAAGGTATAIGLLLLLGACGKSRPVPAAHLAARRHGRPDAGLGADPRRDHGHRRRLPDRPLHADLRPSRHDRRLVVSIIGAVTLVIGAIIGCAYDDIKKVLAYSTVSQIGYMFLAVGIPGAGAIAILHLLTHGFFKACMFLSAGSVMHGMDDQVDMRRFGALRKVMPVTFGCFLFGYLAIIGFPPLRRLLLQGQDHRGGLRQGRDARLRPRARSPCSAPASRPST